MEQKKYFDKENEIDIKELFNKILDQKRVILIISAFFTLIGIITALKTPNIYSASSTFITNNNSPSANGNLGGLASLAGINLGNMQANNSEIPPKLYSKLISSTPFLETLSSVQIPHNESTTTLKNYLTIKNVDDNPTLLFLIKKYTFGLPKVIKNALFKSLTPTTNQRTKSADNLKKVSLENEVLFEAMEKSLTLTIDPTQGFIILSFKDKSKIEYSAEPKIDGISASLMYINGKFIRGLSRGDGSEGEDITQNLRTIKDIPSLIIKKNFPKEIDIRGEVFIDNEDFKTINEKFANPKMLLLDL